MTDPAPLVVTQEDREAAADACGAFRFNAAWELSARNGHQDDSLLVQAFARHASSARELGRKEGIEGAARAAKSVACGGSNGATAALSDKIVAAIEALTSGPIAGERDLEAEARGLLAEELDRIGRHVAASEARAPDDHPITFASATEVAHAARCALIRALSGDKL